MNNQPDLFHFKEEEEKLDIIEKISAIPKIDLHRHLTGSLRFSTVIDIARTNNLDLPYLGNDWTDEEVKNRVILNVSESQTGGRSLKKFIGRPWGILNRLLVNLETIERIAFELVEDASVEPLEYLEIRFSPYGLSTQYKSIPFDARGFMEAIIKGINRARASHPSIEVKIILSVPRHVVADSSFANRERYFTEFIELMHEFRSHVVGADLTGVEEANGNHLNLFEPLFTDVKKSGFGVTIHSGEISSSNEVWTAVEILHADRIGHGIRSIEDKDLINYLSKNNIALEICPSSNLLTGAVENIKHHPAFDLYEQGAPITFNTDNTLVCNTNINHEYELMILNYDFSYEDVMNIMTASKKYRFSNNPTANGDLSAN